eukprot:19507-Alexandrium_andersonii.AAC.1
MEGVAGLSCGRGEAGYARGLQIGSLFGSHMPPLAGVRPGTVGLVSRVPAITVAHLWSVLRRGCQR